MTRALGDAAGVVAGVIAEPGTEASLLLEIFTFPLRCSDKYLVIGSDGLWEFLANQEVAHIVWPHYERNNAEAAADALVKEAHKRWRQEEDTIDDITCVVIFLEAVASS